MGMEQLGEIQTILVSEQAIIKFLDFIIVYQFIDYFNEKSITITTFEGNILIIKIGDFEARPIKWNDFKG